MLMAIANNIKSTLPSNENQNAKDFLKLVEEKFHFADKALARTLMAELTTVKFDDDSFLVQFIMNLLSPEYGSFHINYYTLKDKWNIDEIFSKPIQEEARLKKQRVYSVNFVNQGVDKKLKPKSNNIKNKQRSTTSKVANGEKKEQQNNKCNFCKKEGHFQKDYPKPEKTVPVAEGSSETTTERYMENYKNVSQDIRDQLNAEAEAVQIILTGIDNNIYSTVDACPNACEMWKAIERLKQGESINVQDLETNLYWEFGKFTSQDGESLESYYSRFYKMMNELVRNQCHVTNHQVNVQFLLQLQPEWQRFVTLVKQSQELKTVSYHKLYDILKQHQNEVNEIRAERLARTANPLALVAQQQPVYHHQNHPTQNTQYSSTRSQQSTRNRGKAIVTSSAPTYDPEPATVTEDEEMSKEKEIDKLMALISLSFKKIYKPTNNNLRTSSNTSRANQDNSPRINRGTGYDNQRAVNVAGARENVGTPVVQKSGIQCYNCKEYGHVSREYYYADHMNVILGVYTDLD
ncbi:retrovirus-related pol polyprotein from transposon TNT 1-94, partial [Tanacetum coccineum]